MSGDSFDFLVEGGGCHKNLMGGGQGACQTSCSAQGSPAMTSDPAQSVNRAKTEKPCSKSCMGFLLFP